MQEREEREIKGKKKEKSGEGKNRRSKDKKINRERRKLVVEKTRWSIFNGNIKRDEEGEYTYTGSRESTVIEYVIENDKMRDKI